MGECNFSGGPLQQLHAQSGLECIETATNHGGRDAFSPCGGRQAASGSHIDKGRNLLELIHEIR
jgi:hypothetical protein